MSSPLRVLIVARWGERDGGAEEMLWVILRHLDRSIVDPEVGFLSHGPFVDEVASLGIRTFVVTAGRLRNPFAYARTVARLARIIRRNRPDVVVAWSAKVHSIRVSAAALVGRRQSTVWWQHAIATGHWLDRLATLVPAGEIGCSSRACERAQLRLWPRRQTFVVFPGVEARESTVVVTRREFGIPGDAWVVGIVGRLQPSKGQHRVIRAVAELRGHGVPALALIVGGSAFGFTADYSTELRQLAIDLAVEDDVVFSGQVKDAAPFYPLMDVFVNASEAEPFGIAVVEAMAAGCPSSSACEWWPSGNRRARCDRRSRRRAGPRTRAS